MQNGPQVESAVLCITDAHYGKATHSYNPDISRQRFARLADRLGRIRSLLSGYKFDSLTVCFLGDINDGTGIYPGQEHYQAVSNVEAQADEVSQLLEKFLLKQQTTWGDIRVECVPGNHGRSGRFAHESANWDLTAYRYLKLRLAGEIPVSFNEAEDPFVRKMEVRNWRYLLYHGHDIRTYGNIPWYGILTRTLRWATTAYAPFDAVLMGHFHTCQALPINNVEIMLNGTMVTGDDWALRTFGMASRPQWWLFGVSDSRPVTWRYALDLTE